MGRGGREGLGRCRHEKGLEERLRVREVAVSGFSNRAAPRRVRLDPSTAGYLPLVCAFWSVSSTLSRLKLPTFWLGGNSLNVPRNCATYSCAGTSRKVRSILQCL